MQLRWLEGFVAVAEELHFGRAADRLHVAQSPLSQMIRKLEREIGTELFHRSTRSVELTAAGRALLPYAYRTLRSLGNAVDAARSAAGQPTGRVTLGFSGVHNHHTLPRLTRAFRQRFPAVELRLLGGIRTVDGMRRVRGGDLDACFIGVVGAAPEPLRTREIARHRLGLVLPEGHPLAGEQPVPVSRLRSEPFVMGPMDGSSALTVAALQRCHEAGFHPEVAQTVGDPFLVLSMVAAGVGVAIMSSEVAPVLPAASVWVELAGEPMAFRHGIVWSEENETAPLRALLEVVEEVFPLPEDSV